jgi:hypothetical protein
MKHKTLLNEGLLWAQAGFAMKIVWNVAILERIGAADYTQRKWAAWWIWFMNRPGTSKPAEPLPDWLAGPWPIWLASRIVKPEV